MNPRPFSGSGRALRALARDGEVPQVSLDAATRRRILAFARPYRRHIGAFLGVILLAALAGAAQPLLFRHLIDGGILAGRRDVVLGMAAAAAALALAASGLALLRRYLASTIGEGIVLDLRTQVFEHLQRQPLAFFRHARTGALVSRVQGDVQGAQQAFTSTLSTVVGNVATVVTVLAAMFTLSWPITLVALALLPLFVLPARAAGRRLAVLTRRRYELNADLTQTLGERFRAGGALLVQLDGRPRREAAAFGAQARQLRDVAVTSALYSRVLMTSLGLLAAIATAIVYGAGGWMAISGSLGVGTLVALTAYLGRLYGPITSLSGLQVDLRTTLVSFERVFEVLDLTPQVVDPERPRPLPAGPLAVRFEEVHFAYPAASQVTPASFDPAAAHDLAEATPVLTNLDFEIPAGTMTALVGTSGAGKSTIAALLPRLYDVDAGAVRVGGVDVRELAQEDLRRAIGVVPQDAFLFHRSLRDNLLFVRPEATEEELWAALDDAQLAGLVRSLPAGLDTIVGDSGYRLSGGERQRLALARVLLKAPRLVVLDEATAHLDTVSEAAIQEALGTALRGRTSLVIAHRLSTVRDADQILVVEAGRVVERGRHDELIARRGAYWHLARTQFGDAALGTLAS